MGGALDGRPRQSSILWIAAGESMAASILIFKWGRWTRGKPLPEGPPCHSVRYMTGSLMDPDDRLDASEPPTFAHRPWMVGMVLIFAVLGYVSEVLQKRKGRKVILFRRGSNAPISEGWGQNGETISCDFRKLPEGWRTLGVEGPGHSAGYFAGDG
jgi:hypothetical protein